MACPGYSPRMDLPYPPTPSGIPADLAQPSPTYKRHVALAVAATLLFFGLYLGLMYWFAHTAWALARTAMDGRDGFWAWFAMVPALFLFAFLAKGLFVLKRNGGAREGEITRQDEPALFAFIDRLADEVGAPRPHRVFLSPRVNAAVFYDVSFWNLLVPSKKNLELGLGLVNVLTLDELKAVLAHELGHFAQRSMAVGTWVYTGEQAIRAVVSNRDGFDRFLDGLSRVDLRIAWIGWLLRLVVWSIRVVLDTGFRGLMLIERALSREMEFQADLVAVSVTGSDSLVHALRRLGPADDALDRAVSFSMAEANGGRRVRDLFAVQTEMLGHLRQVVGDPHLGQVPPAPPEGRAAQRVFSPDLAEAPRMWSSHPPNHEREANTKRRYVASVQDDRAAWTLFRDPEGTRRGWTETLYGQLYAEALKKPAVAAEATRVEVERVWKRTRYEPEYRGAYVGRSAVIDEARADALAGAAPADLRAAAESLYPESLVDLIKAWKAAEQHVAQLKALQAGILTAPGGVIRWQGRDIPRSQLDATIQAADRERKDLRRQLTAHDHLVRSVHLAMADQLGKGWPLHLRGQVRVLHYLEHAAADLTDAAGALNTTFHVVVADNNVSASEMTRLLEACAAQHRALAHIYGSAAHVRLPADALAHLRVKSWQGELAEEFRLGPPTREALAANWLQAADTWVRAADSALDRAAGACLDSLLCAEAKVREAWLAGADPGDAPEPPRAPPDYATLVPGQERSRPTLGWWDRFQIADGVGPGVVRLGASALILGPAAFVTWQIGTAHVVIFNGLAQPVSVLVGEARAQLGPHEWSRITIPTDGAVPVVARLDDGSEIERFEVAADTPAAEYVYNVAGADAFVTTYVAYGNIEAPEPRPAGAQRWFEADEDYVAVEAPRSIDSKHATTRTRLEHLAPYGPSTMLTYAGDDAVPLARAHLRWDPVDSAEFTTWLQVAAGDAEAAALIDERITADGLSVPLARARQELGGAAACERDKAASAAAPDDPDRLYLALRCDDATPPEAWAAAYERFPEHPWMRWAMGWDAMRARDWARARALLENPPASLGDHGIETWLRAERLAGAPPERQRSIASRLSQGEYLTGLLEAEAGEVSRPSDLEDVRVEQLRVAGDLGGYLAASEDPDELWRVACADGASVNRDLQALAGGRPASGGYALWCYAAVRANRGELDDADLAAVREAQPTLAALVEPVLRAAPADVVAAVDTAAAAADPTTRAYVLLVGQARLREATPPAWTAEVRGALLPWERWALR